MTANSPSSVAESAGSTIDPDVRARLASDGELNAEFHSDLTTDDDAVDGLLTGEDFADEFGENRADVTLYAEYRRLAAEQAALRRLATLVARGVEPVEVFGAVAEEMRRCVPADTAGLWRFESDREITFVAAAADPEALARWPVGTRTPVQGNTLATLVHRSGRPARIDSYDNVAGAIAARVRAVGVHAAVGVPIIVDSRMWGLAVVGCLRPGPMPADTEAHITRFAELTATAVVAGYRDEQNRQLLAEASQQSNRAAASERRRIERDLHDGAQQRLVTIALALRLAESRLASDSTPELRAVLSKTVADLQDAIDELRDLARGIHPASLESGLSSALESLVDRSPLPVRLDLRLDGEPPSAVAHTAYFAVAEALTNIIKHANAHEVTVRAVADNGTMRVQVTDDGDGGADADNGTGLRGIADRVAAVGGSMQLHSPPGAGTSFEIDLPCESS